MRGAPRCPKHTAARDAERGTPEERGYDAAWRRLRAQVLKAKPLCELCLAEGKVTPATVGDHIVSVKVAPHLRLVASNVRALCKPHHDRRVDEGDFGR